VVYTDRVHEPIFSEREYAVARPSASVCNARTPYSAGLNYRKCFYAIWYTLAIR